VDEFKLGVHNRTSWVRNSASVGGGEQAGGGHAPTAQAQIIQAVPMAAMAQAIIIQATAPIA